MTFRLSRLPTNWQDQPQLFERYWDETLTQLEKALNSILEIPLIQASLVAVNAATANAQTAANNANTAAATAQSAANAAAIENSIVNSYVTGFAGNLIVSDRLGNVTIVNHTRVYGDTVLNPSRAVTGNTIATGAASGSTVRVFYDDPTRVGGAVTYQFTVDPAASPTQKGNRHSVGAVLVPAAGTNNGRELTPPGYVQL